MREEERCNESAGDQLNYTVAPLLLYKGSCV